MLAILAAFVVIAAILTIPVRALLVLDRNHGGPKVLRHVIANVLFVAWVIYEWKFTQQHGHGPHSAFLIIPTGLAIAFCYLVISPRLTDEADRQFVVFRRVVGFAYLLVFVVAVATAFYRNSSG